MSPQSNSVIPVVLYRANGFWSIVNTTAYGNGKNFKDDEPLILQSLTHAGLDAVMLEETKNWRAKNGKVFNLKKDDVICIPQFSDTISVALGWDAGCDIDASILFFDKNMMQKDCVYYGKKSSSDGAV